eukprot:9595616-Heterocapsa_arctica.AAC.1
MISITSRSHVCCTQQHGTPALNTALVRCSGRSPLTILYGPARSLHCSQGLVDHHSTEASELILNAFANSWGKGSLPAQLLNWLLGELR